jgi:HK97 family phage portal protein
MFKTKRNLLRLTRRRGDHVERSLLWPSDMPSIFGGRAGDVTPSSALAVANVWTCVKALTDAAASLPLIPYRRTAAGRERVESGLLAELLRRPAPAVTQANMVASTVAALVLHGNCFLGKYRDNGRIVQLGLLDPACVQVVIEAGEPFYLYVDPRGRRQRLTTRDVLHIKALSTDGIVGLSLIRQCREALGVSRDLTRHAANFFQNAAVIPGAIALDKDVDAESFKEFTELFREEHEGPANAGKMLMLGGGATFTPTSAPPEDLEFVAQRKLSATEVAAIFRIPGWVVNAESGSSMTYSNTEAQLRAFLTLSVRPWLVLIEQAITGDPDLCRGPGTFVEFLDAAILQADHKTRAEIYALALDPETGWMTREEVRRRENLAPETRSETGH